MPDVVPLPHRKPRALRAKVALSSSSVYPENVESAFSAAARLGYDGVEVLILGDPDTQAAAPLRRLMVKYAMPILAIHAPTLLLTQQVYGAKGPWTKVDRSVELALDLGTDVVVLHPPFRWQKYYADSFCDGVATREDHYGVRLAVENMYPWRAGSTNMQAYLPHWDPVPQPFDHVTLDLSHSATAHSNVLEMQRSLGDRLIHVHLADGTGSFKDEHAIPGRGTQPCDHFVDRLAQADYDGVVTIEISTRKRSPQARDQDLLEALEFARHHLGQDHAYASREQPRVATR